jgi:hypothetical protein
MAALSHQSPALTTTHMHIHNRSINQYLSRLRVSKHKKLYYTHLSRKDDNMQQALAATIRHAALSVCTQQMLLLQQGALQSKYAVYHFTLGKAVKS